MQSVLCSSVWYIRSLTSVPNKVETIALTFLWNSKPEALKIESLLNTFADIRTKIESIFVKQVLQLSKEHRAKWTFLAVNWLGIHLKEYVVMLRLYPPKMSCCWFMSG